MAWDLCEGNFFGNSSAALTTIFKTVPDVIAHQHAMVRGDIFQADAMKESYPEQSSIIDTDPPCYNNISYADLSDFFYVWLRRSASPMWPELTRRLVTPKIEELVATPYRHGSAAEAEAFFMRGMSQTFSAMRAASLNKEPTIIYYAFIQSEAATDGVTSAGWATFLQGLITSGFVVDGTWPLRTESAGRLIGRGANALASSVVLVCRKGPADAPTIGRADLMRALKREMPDAIAAIRKAGVGPVDMQQSVIGPGMGVFSSHAAVREDDDSAMSVRTALALINRVWAEIEDELDGEFNAPTQVALAWYGSHGFEAKPSGELIALANAKNTADRALFSSGVFTDGRGRSGLTSRDQLPTGWSPEADRTLTVWECVQHTARALAAEDGSAAAAARLVAGMGATAAEARKLAYRLFEIATKNGWSAEALVYNELAEEWPRLEEMAANLVAARPEAAAPAQALLI